MDGLDAFACVVGQRSWFVDHARRVRCFGFTLASIACFAACGAPRASDAEAVAPQTRSPQSALPDGVVSKVAASAADGGAVAPVVDEAGNSASRAKPSVAGAVSMPAGPVVLAIAGAGAGAKTQPGAAGAGSHELDAGMHLRELCSGCAAEQHDRMDMSVHLHHVHLNVKSREASAQFYEKYFKAERVLLNDAVEALRVVPTLLLFDEPQRPSAPRHSLPTALQHIGWGAADTAAWYEAARAQGIMPDTRGFTLFNTMETPTIGESGSGAIIALSGDVPGCFPIPDVASYMYVLGPDQERIEVWSGVDGRVNHVHFTAADLVATSAWYQRVLGLPSATPLLSYQFFLDDILFFFEPIGAAADYAPTDDHALGHIGLAVTDLDAWRARVQQQNIQVVAEPADVHGFRSFFVRGPDGILIELVEAAKSPDLCPG